MMCNNDTILIQKDDSKSYKWAQSASQLRLNIIQQRGSAIRAPLFLLRYILKNKKPKAYIIRYLNDYPSLIKTILRAFSEIVLIGICKITKVKVFWICHNVDRESTQHFPRISELRRNLIAFCSLKIFVMDALLVECAKHTFPKHESKIDYISFGEVEGNEHGNGDKDSISFLYNSKKMAVKNKQKFLSVICAGSPSGEKCLHFQYLIKLIETAREKNFYLAVIVAGNWGTDEKSRKLLESYRNISNILIFEKYISFSASFIKNNIDFYFRGYDDYSVPFTIYEACSLKKPILALKTGFLPEMVELYELGIITDEKFRNLEQSLEELSAFNSSKLQEFLEIKKWSSLGERLLLYI